jgi:hypothetical protein
VSCKQYQIGVLRKQDFLQMMQMTKKQMKAKSRTPGVSPPGYTPKE